MKLNDQIKKQIDAYFDSIKAEHLFEIAVTKYKFVDVGVQYSGSFTSVNIKHFVDKLNEDFDIPNEKISNYTIAA